MVRSPSKLTPPARPSSPSSQFIAFMTTRNHTSVKKTLGKYQYCSVKKSVLPKGLKTLVLERGRNVEHIKDYTDTSKDPWELDHHGGKTVTNKNDSPIQSKCYAYNEVSGKFFVNDVENPYNQVKPFDWIRGYHVGGRSLLWGRQCYRWSDVDFGANATDGYGVDWPIRYADLAPWYS